jgi:CHAD domain-containing protein
VLGADAADIARHMNDHQDDLGAVCDARANINLVNEFLNRDLDKSLAHELKKIKNENQDVLFNILKEHGHKK